MPSLIAGYEYDIFISYRQKDNRQDGWVTQFVKALQNELDATFKEDVSIYFDVNPSDGLLETHDVEDSLKGKLKCLVFIPIISQTYCDPKSFAWQHEFLAFKKITTQDAPGLKIKLPGGNVANRILPVRIHELDPDDRQLAEEELGGVLRSIDFIYKSSGVNRPLTAKDDEIRTPGQILYRDQINKVANSIKELIAGMRNMGGESRHPRVRKPAVGDHPSTGGLWEELKRRNIFRVVTVYAGAGWLIVQIALATFTPLHLPEWALTLLIAFILLGFPIAIILAWAFEGSPQGTLIETRSDQKKRFAPRVAIVAIPIVIIISLFTYFKFFNNPITDKSVAVIPFVNMTGDKGQEYFSDGMTEEILNHLSKISTIRVISRQSSMKYKGSKLTIPEIASALGVATVLEGSVRRSGDKIRITAQLIDARTDKHLWSEDYDYRDLKDIFALQTQVSIQIANVLKARLTDQEKGELAKMYTTNIQAYKSYLRGRFFWDKRNKVSYDSAEINFNRAIEIDPDYALAYVGLADCYTFVNFKGLPQVESIPIAKAYINRALLLDSNLCEALTTVGFIRSHFEYDWNGAKPILEKAMRLNPNYPFAHVYYGNVCLFNGQDERRGIREIKKALQLDPLSSSINWVLGRSYFHAHKYDSAAIQLQKALALDPKYEMSRLYLSLTLVQKKDYGGAIKMANPDLLKKLTRQEGKLVTMYIQAISGDKTNAKIELDRWLGLKKIYSPYWLAHVYVALGEHEKALTELELDYDARAIEMDNVRNDPAFDPLHREPRFQEILRKMNLN